MTPGWNGLSTLGIRRHSSSNAWPRTGAQFQTQIKRNDWLLADMCVHKQPIIALYFEFENVLKFYNLEPWRTDYAGSIAHPATLDI